MEDSVFVGAHPKRKRDPGDKGDQPSKRQRGLARELMPGAPNDIVLNEIFNLLTTKELLRLSEVNSSWFTAATGSVIDADETLTARFAMNLSSISSTDTPFITLFKNLRSIKLDYNARPIRPGHEDYFPASLRTIHFESPYHSFRRKVHQPQFTNKQLASLTQLETLIFGRSMTDWDYREDTFAALTNLTELQLPADEMGGSLGPTGSTIFTNNVLCRLPKLAILHAEAPFLNGHYTCLSPTLFHTLVYYKPSYEYEYLDQSVDLYGLETLTGLTSLGALSGAMVVEVTRQRTLSTGSQQPTWGQVFGALTNLRELTLASADTDELTEIMPLIAQLPQLATLRLFYVGSPTILSFPTSLTSLEIDDPYHSETVGPLLTAQNMKSLGNLRTLKFEGGHMFFRDYESLRWLSRLEVLDMNDLHIRNKSIDDRLLIHRTDLVGEYPRTAPSEEEDMISLDLLAFLRAPLRVLNVTFNPSPLLLHGANLLLRLWPTLERINGLPIEAPLAIVEDVSEDDDAMDI